MLHLLQTERPDHLMTTVTMTEPLGFSPRKPHPFRGRGKRLHGLSQICSHCTRTKNPVYSLQNAHARTERSRQAGPTPWVAFPQTVAQGASGHGSREAAPLQWQRSVTNSPSPCAGSTRPCATERRTISVCCCVCRWRSVRYWSRFWGKALLGRHERTPAQPM